MSPASYRAAPPRVGELNLTRDLPPGANRTTRLPSGPPPSGRRPWGGRRGRGRAGSTRARRGPRGREGRRTRRLRGHRPGDRVLEPPLRLAIGGEVAALQGRLTVREGLLRVGQRLLQRGRAGDRATRARCRRGGARTGVT